MRLPQVAIISVLLLEGCAAATVGRTRNLTVVTDNGVRAECVLRDKQSAYVIPSTPGSALVTGADGPMHISCIAPGWRGDRIIGTIPEEAIFGNLAFGPAAVVGLIGDTMDGASVKYRDAVMVHMSPTQQN
jgi:hypothetical protein